MKLKTSAFTLQGLINHIETSFTDQSIQSNYWEGKYNLKELEGLLEESLVKIDGTAFVSLEDGLAGIDFEEEDTPNMEDTILLYGIDGIYHVPKEVMKDRIKGKQEELSKLQFLMDNEVFNHGDA